MIQQAVESLSRAPKRISCARPPGQLSPRRCAQSSI